MPKVNLTLGSTVYGTDLTSLRFTDINGNEIQKDKYIKNKEYIVSSVRSVTGTTYAFVASTKTITDSGNGFINAGFYAGETITITGSASNNITATITSIVAGTITLDSTATIVTESAGASVTITGSVTSLADYNNIGEYLYKSISTATTTVIKTGSGIIGNLIIAGGTAGAITVYDNTSASSPTIIATFTPGAVSVPVCIPINARFNTGLTILTGAATVITVTYK